MFGSLFIGLGGLQAYSSGLRQVSNNISNLNSAGFRSSTLGFNDLFSGSSQQGISYTGAGQGGGNGVSLSDLRLDFSQGELRQSERDLDLAIEGTGFLVLENDGEYVYARTGQFEVNEAGEIVLSGSDYKLTVLDSSGRPQSLSVDNHRTGVPAATTRIEFSDNLSSTSTTFSVPDVRVFNENGAESTWQIQFSRDENVTDEWTVTVTNENGDEVGSEELNFINGAIDPSTSVLTFADEEAGLSVDLDFSEGVTSFSSGEISTLRASDIDGYGIGEITTLRVNDSGHLEISYSNEQTEDLGAVALADFREPQNLEQQSGGLFTYNSTVGREFHSSESNQVGRVLSARVENSNVDLSREFGELILVQRGYQASSQIVSVSNDMIQQLFGITGRG